MTERSPHRYGPDYREEIALADGTRVELRLVRPDDKALFVEGFARLSEESRYRRFFGAKSRLTDAELKYLTELDGEHHFALGAVRHDPDGHIHGVGIARFNCLPDDCTMAEPAVAVTDDAQNRGLGRALLERLVGAAYERGVRRFRFEVLASNEPMRTLVHELAPGAHESREGDVIVCEIELPELPPPPSAVARETPLYRLLALVARGMLLVRRAFVGLGLAPPGEPEYPPPVGESADTPPPPDPRERE